MQFLFIGCGNMGAAIAAGALHAFPDAGLTVIDPDIQRAQSLLPVQEVTFHTDISAVEHMIFDATIFAIKPQQFHTFTTDLLPQSSGLYISIMAGVTLEGLKKNLQSERVVRTMPNLAATVARSMSVGVAAEEISASDKLLVEKVFEGSGRFEWLADEKQVDSVTAVAGSGPGYLFSFAQYMIEAAKAEGLPDELADILVRQTFLGASELLHSDPRSAFDLKRAVTSKRGTTEAGLAKFEAKNGFPELCLLGVKAARQRAEELAGET